MLGRRVYQCLQCGKNAQFSPIEMGRAARARCYGCGSTRLELSKAGQAQLAKVQAVRALRARPKVKVIDELIEKEAAGEVPAPE